MSLPLSRCAAIACGTAGLFAAAIVTVSPTNADGFDQRDQDAGRFTPVRVIPRRLPALEGSVTPFDLGGAGSAGGGLSGTCGAEVVTHTDFDFQGGALVLQQGFAEDEVAAASYTVPSDHFPVRIDVTEMIFGQSTNAPTQTQWSLLIWEGTPSNGALVYEFSSDDVILPHLNLPLQGSNAANIQVQVDPDDPEQLYVNDNGSQTFTVGYRIDQHNNQSGNPCVTPPPSSSNAFPATDVSGLAAPTGNWLCAVDGAFCVCAPGMCQNFQQLLGPCTPSGDWLLRVTYTPANCGGGGALGACCLPDGLCLTVFDDDCEILGGTFLGADTACETDECPEPTVPCCFPATSGCLDLDAADCTAAGGVPGTVGSTCSDIVCFPSGACCLVDGSCAGGMSPEDCDAAGGVFQGDGVDCASVSCPEPVGGCCFDTGFCLVLSEVDCEGVGATWSGVGTDCTDADQNGSADACESTGIPEDLDGDGDVDGADLGILLGAWGPCEGCPADINGDGVVNGADLGQLLGAWTT